MPDPKVCNKIKDPVERQKCLSYQGKYAKKGKKASSPAKKAGGSSMGY